jgi:tumor protein p53-inducible protein 3
MKAIIVQTEKADRPLVLQEVASPAYSPDDVLVDVHATALNRADLAQRAGHYPPPAGASDILGLEMAGVIRKVGAAVTTWRPGDQVCALLTGGGYATEVVVPQGMLMPVPQGWSLQEAAAMPEVFFTAFLNLFLEGGLKAGETVLVHGGASGVGTAAIQLAREAGARVIATAGTDEKAALCKDLGAFDAINYRAQDFGEGVWELTDGQGVDLVLDMVGADYFERNIRVLRTNGRLVFIATLSGKEAQLDIRTLMAKRLMLKGSTLRARPLEEKIRLKEAFMTRFWTSLERRTLKPVIDCIYPIEQAEAAHSYMRENRNMGKIVLEVRSHAS